MKFQPVSFRVPSALHPVGRAMFPPDTENACAMVARCWRLLGFDSNNPDVWHALGTALAELGHRAASLTALRNAVLLDESRADTHLALGKLLFDSGRLDDALRCFDRAAVLTG
jgi:tetratricopeptide (TPR) repeat protein